MEGGSAVPAYRFYRLDRSGKIVTGDWVAADDDAEALGHARQRARGGYFELWDRNRLVGREPSGER